MSSALVLNLIAWQVMISRIAAFALASLLLIGLGCSPDKPRGEAVAAPPEGVTGQQQRFGYILARGPELLDVAANGGSRKVVSFDDGSTLMDPALSPDGRRIAFIRQEPARTVAGKLDFGADLYVVNRDGSGLKEVVHHGDLAEYVRTPSWLSADEVLFSVRGRTPEANADYRIERLDLRSGQRTRLVANAVDPSVGPKRAMMTYVTVETSTTKEGIVLARVDGSGGRSLLPPEPVLTLVGSTVLSPDQTRVAFAAGDLLGAIAAPPRSSSAEVHPYFQDLWIINADGSDLHRVAEVVERSLSLSWSPDGRWLYAMGATKFRRIDAQTGEITVLGEGAEQGGVFVYELK